MRKQEKKINTQSFVMIVRMGGFKTLMLLLKSFVVNPSSVNPTKWS